MSDVSALLTEPPDPKSGLRKAVEAERRKVDLWEAGLIKAIRHEKDRLLRELTQTEAAMVKPPTASSRRSKKARGRTARRRQPTAVGQKQREAILGLLRSGDREMAMGEIRKALNIPDSSARNAMNGLVEIGVVRQVGTGSRTKYVATSNGKNGSTRSAQDSGTLRGRLLEAIVNRGRASLEELAEIVGAPTEEVQRNCGVLIREEEVRMDRKEGQSVYVSAEIIDG